MRRTMSGDHHKNFFGVWGAHKGAPLPWQRAEPLFNICRFHAGLGDGTLPQCCLQNFLKKMSFSNLFKSNARGNLLPINPCACGEPFRPFCRRCFYAPVCPRNSHGSRLGLMAVRSAASPSILKIRTVFFWGPAQAIFIFPVTMARRGHVMHDWETLLRWCWTTL